MNLLRQRSLTTPAAFAISLSFWLFLGCSTDEEGTAPEADVAGADEQPTAPADDGGVAGDPVTEPSEDPGSDADETVVFELLGSWEYTGGFAGLTNLLSVHEAHVEEVGDYQGTGWEITYDLVSWDNEADQATILITETIGFSHFGVGETLYLSWVLTGDTLVLYSPTEGHVDPSGGSEGSDFTTYTRL